LQESITKAKGKVEADYTADSWANLQAVLTESETLYENGDATQDQVNDQVTKLEKAIANLVKKPVDEPTTDPSVTKPTPAAPANDSEWQNISTAEELKNIGATGYYRLTNNITFENKVDITEFNGVLDGNGFSIIRENTPFDPIFTTIGSDGVIQNLGIEGEKARKVLAETLKGKVLNSYSWLKGNESNLIDVMEPGAVIYNTYTLPKNSAGIGYTGNGGDIINSYWTSEQPFYFDKYQTTLTDSFKKSDTEIKSDDFLAILNENATGFKTWYQGEGGAPQFQEYQPDVLEYPLTFTEYGPTTNVIDITEKGVFRTDVFGDERGYLGKFEVKNYQNPVSWTFENEKNIQPLVSISKNEGEVFAQGVEKGTIIATDAKTGTELARIPFETFVPDNFDLQLKIKDVDYTGKDYVLKGSSGVGIDPFVSVNNSPYAKVKTNLFDWSSDKPKSLNVGTDGWVTVYKEDTARIKVSLGSVDKTINFTSNYIPVESIKPNFEGTYVIHRRNPNSIGQNGKPGIADFNPLSNKIPGTNEEDLTSQQKLAIVTPENATYSRAYTVTSSNTDVLNYHASLQNTIVPYKEGKTQITVTSNDPNLTEQKTGTS
ncbi:MAG: FIVAR domain-containing protein, partial [Tissierellia bacterium]|nr:FIVAR domain-containing protein [Tissierellia bacterium]